MLKPGCLVGVKEQAEQLGISMMPVREAVKKLQQEGLVVQEPRKEPIVAPLSAKDMEDIYMVRMSLEGMAIERGSQNMSQADYDYLCDLLDRFVTAYDTGDVKLGRELHRKFHVDLSAMARSSTLDRLIPPLLDTSERYRVLSVPLRGSAGDRRNEHQRILDACLRKDGIDARRLLTEHLSKTVELVRSALQNP